MSSKYVSRLDPTTYARPKKTKTESVQDEKSIQHYLKDYEEIDQKELPYINPNTHIRYISWDKKNKCELFRFGGLLVRIQPQYVQLAGIEGKLFSAQRYTYAEDKKKVIHMTRFFRKMKQTEVMKESGYLYFVDKNGNIARAKMSRAGRKKGRTKKEVVAKTKVKKESGYLYFVDKKGNVARAKMARGRKAGKKKATKKKVVKKKAAKKTTKKKATKKKVVKKKAVKKKTVKKKAVKKKVAKKKAPAKKKTAKKATKRKKR